MYLNDNQEIGKLGHHLTIDTHLLEKLYLPLENRDVKRRTSIMGTLGTFEMEGKNSMVKRKK